MDAAGTPIQAHSGQFNQRAAEDLPAQQPAGERLQNGVRGSGKDRQNKLNLQ
jgi:hypothetical protein